MTWWTSIVFYLWRNSIRRWIEQPLGVLSKLAVAALIGGLGAVMMMGVSYLGKQISNQLASREALMVNIIESVPRDKAGGIVIDQVEEKEWGKLAKERLTLLTVLAAGFVESDRRPMGIYAASNPESLGYPDALILLTEDFTEGMKVIVLIQNERFEAIAMRPRGEMIQDMVGDTNVLLGSVRRMKPLLEKGFSRRTLLEAKSVEAVEHIDKVIRAMKVVEGRRVQMRSSLHLLVELRKIRVMQRNIALAVAIGSSLTLGLICGALAWMEFREERYLLSLIRSFGVGQAMLFGHAVLENCIVAVSGMLLGLGVLAVGAKSLSSGTLRLAWLDLDDLMQMNVIGVLLLGALFGGLLSCVPVAIGLRKPLGLTLK